MATEKKQPTANTENEVKETPKTTPVVKKAPTVAKRSAKKEAEEMKDPEVKIESALNRTEEYLQRNGKKLLTILIILVLIAVAIISYFYLIHGKRAEKAGAAMFAAEQLFIEESYDIALNGDGNNAGFLEIIDRYGATPQGNIAKHYAGVSYLKLGDEDNALRYLQQYKNTKGSPNEILNAQNKGLQGDLYVQKGDYERAISLYQDAVGLSDNSFTTPMYLKKLGLVYDRLGRHAESKETFERIKNEYGTSMEARDVDKYIGAQEQK